MKYRVGKVDLSLMFVSGLLGHQPTDGQKMLCLDLDILEGLILSHTSSSAVRISKHQWQFQLVFVPHRTVLLALMLSVLIA